MTVSLQSSGQRRGLTPLREVLPNGVRVLVSEARTTPAVALDLSIDAGSVCDPDQAPGLASFVSRTIDRGTEQRSADEIAETLDGRGVSLVTSITRHTLSLACTCLAEDLHAVLALLADMVRRPAFPAAEVDTRRGELLTRIRQDAEDPAAVATDTLMRLLYGARHPFGRPALGTENTVGEMTRPDLVAFHRAHVAPTGLTIALVGDVEPRRAVDAAAAVLADWQAHPPDPVRLEAPDPAGSRRTEVVPMMSKSQTDVAYGFTSITRDDPDYYAYWLMNNVLGEYSLGGRLGDSIRERQGMAYYVSSTLGAGRIPGPLMIRAGVSPANVARAVASIDEELTRLVAEGPTDTEVAESKQYLIGSLPRHLETNAGIASFLQTIEFFGLGLDYADRLPGLLSAVTRDQVHAAARRALDPAKAAVVVAGPYDGPLA
jgi:zinc protease